MKTKGLRTGAGRVVTGQMGPRGLATAELADSWKHVSEGSQGWSGKGST